VNAVTWALLKEVVVDTTGLSKDVLHAYLGLMALFSFSAILDWPIASFLSWLAVLLLELGNEVMDLVFWYMLDRLEIAQWHDSLSDLIITMILPTIFVLAARGLRHRTVAEATYGACRDRQ
jgi:hypothetical protein